MARGTTQNVKPYTVYTVGRPRRRWPRVLFTTVLVFMLLTVAAVGGVYLWLDLKVSETNVGRDSSEIEALLQETTTSADVTETTLSPPNAQNILLLGSDSREGEGDTYGRSDTLMLVHVDPEQDFVSVLSLPRDLRVELAEGRGVQKLNAAYAIGGAALAIKTVQQVTGVDLDHFVNIDFDAFRDVTTALEGIYIDVDRRYYYKGLDYEIIDIKPGYQPLVGEDALDYVRFRHDGNNDFGRIVRQQRFLRAAKEQVSTWDAALKIPTLVDLLARNVSTDIKTTQALKLAVWGARLGGGRIKQVDLEAGTDEIGGASYVVATEVAISNAVRDLMTPPAPTKPVSTATTATTGATPTTDGTATTGEATSPSTTGLPMTDVDLAGLSVDVQNGNGRPGEAAAAAGYLRGLGAKVVQVGDASSFEVSRTHVLYPAKKKAQAQSVAKALGTERLEADAGVDRVTAVLGADFGFPEAYEPTLTIDDLPDKGEYIALRSKSGIPMVAPSYLPEDYKRKDSRIYEIPTEGGSEPAVKVVYRYGSEDQYLGLMATTFTDAPAASEGQQVTVGDTTYTVVEYGGRVDHIWWERDGVLFWVSNTLSYLLDRDEMLKVATGMVPVP